MKKLELQKEIGVKGIKIVPVEIEEKEIALKACKVSYSEENGFSKFLVGNERIDAESLPLISALPPMETFIHEKNPDPEHEKKFIYKAAKILVVVKIEKNFYGPNVGNEIQEKAIHGFVDGVNLHDALEDPSNLRDTNIKDGGESYNEITVYQTKEHELKRMWVERQTHSNSFSSEPSHEINIMIQSKDDVMFRGIIEVEDAQKFLASIFYNDDLFPDDE